MAMNLYGNQPVPATQRAAVMESGFTESIYDRIQNILSGPGPQQDQRMAPSSPSPSMGGAGAMGGMKEAAAAAFSDSRVREAALVLAATAAKIGVNAAAIMIPGGVAGRFLAMKAAEVIGERLDNYLNQDQDNRQSMGPGMSSSPAPRMR